METTTLDKKTFAFGKNWQRFVKMYNPKRLEIAKQSMLNFMNLDNLSDKSFMDVGCGSGLYSAAALELGAQVISFDVDQESVECCQIFKNKYDNTADWQIYHGSILDKEFLSGLPQADIVYSYGVLHHTGKMWEALDNIKPLVKKNGLLCIAIYNKMHGTFSGSKAWAVYKQIFNKLPKPLQYLSEGLFFFRRNFLPYVVRLQNPVKSWREYHDKRGESLWVDLRDWLGGYPYEFAAPDEIFNFYKDEFELQNLLTKNTLALNAFLFKKR